VGASLLAAHHPKKFSSGFDRELKQDIEMPGANKSNALPISYCGMSNVGSVATLSHPSHMPLG
jgi:hypothetical protein